MDEYGWEIKMDGAQIKDDRRKESKCKKDVVERRKLFKKKT